jgi:hypothetical protein
MIMLPNGSDIVKYFLTISLFLLVIGTGCKKLVQVSPPDTQLTEGTVFSNDSLAQSAVNGLYIKIMSSSKYFLNGGTSLYPGLSADEVIRTSPSPPEDQFSSNILVATNLLNYSNLWKAAYSYIYQCNICIAGLEKSTGVSDEVKKRLTGEVQFVRALCYFHLVNLYGDVPLVLSTNADVNAVLPRSAADDVYAQIITDLQSAGTLLTNDFANTTPSQLAAQALLARVYLYRQSWNLAETNASSVINAGKYKLQSDLNTVFKSNSTETIFQWVPVAVNMNASEGNIFIPPTPAIRPVYKVCAVLLTAFETGDLRKSSWIKTVTVSGQTYSYPYKYKIYNSSTPGEYNIVLRLAEQYLIRAEARAQQNNVADAVADINVIRTRAGLPPFSSAISKDQCLLAIEQERRVELFTEWGHRWFDLKRTNRADAVLSALKGANWQSTDRLYPIPQSERETDANLDQNPGYD